MSTLSPPVPLEHPENQARVDWIQDISSQPDFDYPHEFYEHTEVLWKDKGVQVWRSIQLRYLKIQIQYIFIYVALIKRVVAGYI